jgi:pimeloyl-ACP methyl ester carboxylesterase
MRIPAVLICFGCLALPAQTPARLPDIGYDASAPLSLEEGPIREFRDCRLLDISFAGPRGGRVTAYAVVPKGLTHPAGIVWQHWGQGDRSSFLPEALTLGNLGAASILLNAPWLLPHFRSAQTPQQQLAQWLEAAVNIRRAADVLATRYGVPSRQMAYVGHSYGATLGGVIAAGDRRFRFLVLMGGFASLSDATLHPAGSGVPPGAKTRKLAAALSVIDAERYIGSAPPAAVFLQFARYDRYITVEQAERYAAAAREPKLVRWYDCGHEFNDRGSMGEREEWLTRALQLSGASHVARAAPAVDDYQLYRAANCIWRGVPSCVVSLPKLEDDNVLPHPVP